MSYRNAYFVAVVGIAATTLIGCGRFGFNDGSFDTVAVSEPDALVGCSNAVAGAGDGSFGVVWHEYPAPGGNQHSLMFSRVSSSGEAAEPLVLDRIDAPIEHVELYASGQGFVAFYFHESSGSLFAAHIDSSGALVSTEEIGVSAKNLSIAPNGDGFGLFVEDKGDLEFISLGPDGVPLAEPIPLNIPGTVDPEGYGLAERPSAAYTATGYHLVYEMSWGSEIGYANLNETGVTQTSWVEDFGTHRLARIASDGKGRLGITWFDGEVLTEYAVDEVGRPLWSGVRQVVAANRQESQFPVLAGGDGSLAMVWESDADALLPQIVFRSFPLDSVDSSTATLEQITEGDHVYTCPQLTRGAGQFATVFRGQIEGRQQLFVGVRHD